MNFRDRFLRTLQFQSVDRVPLMDFGYWVDTVKRWRQEGLPPQIQRESEVERFFNLDRGLDPWHTCFNWKAGKDDVLYVEVNWFDHWGDFFPPFDETILAEDEEYVTKINSEGVTLREKKGLQGMPQFLSYPVKTMKDFETLLPRLDGRHPARYPSDWEKRVREYQLSDRPLGFYLTGFFGFTRGLMGLENLCMAYYDDPDMVHAIAEQHTQFVLDAYQRALIDLQIDFVVIFEDMAYKSGALISPAIFKKFMMPYYIRLVEFLRSHRVKIILVDSDGNVNNLLALLMEVGVDGILPCEVRAGSDPTVLRKKYPKASLIGGIDKMALESDFASIDRELEKLPALLELGGYIPGIDHLVPPTVSYDNYRYFCDQRRKIVERYT
jgi:uroporphyrinogen-III decarboxylase